jgi:hypothetical protein
MRLALLHEAVTATMEEVSKLRSELAQGLTETGEAQQRFNESVQRAASVVAEEVLNLRADCLLLRTVVAALWGQASPDIRDQIRLILESPAEAIFSGSLDENQVQHLKSRGTVFREHLDQVAI